jgi:hypothetical protein
MSIYNKAKNFYDEVMIIANRMGLIIVADRIIMIDRETNESTTMQIMPKGENGA